MLQSLWIHNHGHCGSFSLIEIKSDCAHNIIKFKQTLQIPEHSWESGQYKFLMFSPNFLQRLKDSRSIKNSIIDQILNLIPSIHGMPDIIFIW